MPRRSLPPTPAAGSSLSHGLQIDDPYDHLRNGLNADALNDDLEDIEIPELAVPLSFSGGLMR